MSWVPGYCPGIQTAHRRPSWVWQDGELLLLVASTTLDAAMLMAIAQSIYGPGRT